MYAAIILAAQIVFLSSPSAHARLSSMRMLIQGASVTTVTATVEVETTRVSSRHSFGVVEEKALRQYVQKSIHNIRKVTSSNQYTRQQKLEYVKKVVETVANYRARNWTKSSYLEHELDLMIKPFESFPDSSRFQSRSCNKYEHHLILEWEPGAQSLRPSQKGVAEALSVLRHICKG